MQWQQAFYESAWWAYLGVVTAWHVERNHWTIREYSLSAGTAAEPCPLVTSSGKTEASVFVSHMHLTIGPGWQLVL